MDGFGLLLMMTLSLINIVTADGVNETGYVGCYPVGPHWQDLLSDEASVSSVNDCVMHCSNTTYCAISVRTCFCSNTLANIQRSNDDNCNVKCFCNSSQMCGSSKGYSVYNTKMATLSISANGCATSSDSPTSEAVKNTMPADGHYSTCGLPQENRLIDTNCSKEIVEKCCQYHPVWLRSVIEVAVIVGALLLLIIFVCFRRYIKHRNLRRSTAREDYYTDIPGPRSSVPVQGVDKSSQTLLVLGTSDSFIRSIEVDEPLQSNGEMSDLPRSDDGPDSTNKATTSSNLIGHTYSSVIKGPTTSVDSETSNSSMAPDSDDDSGPIVHSYATFTKTCDQATSIISKEHDPNKVEVNGLENDVKMDKDGYAQLMIEDKTSIPDQNVADAQRICTARCGSQRRIITERLAGRGWTGMTDVGVRKEGSSNTIPQPDENYENRGMWRPRERHSHRK